MTDFNGDDSIYVRIASDAAQFTKGLNEADRAVETLEADVQSLVDVSKQLNITLQQAGQQIKLLGREPLRVDKVVLEAQARGLENVSISAKEAAENFEAMSGAQTKLGTSGKNTTGIIGSLGKSISHWIAGTLFFTAIGAIYKLGDAIADAVQQAVEFTKSIYEMNVAVRALQRQGLDITIGQVSKEIKALRSEFQGFSLQDLTKGYSNILLLSRNLGLSTEQMSQMSKITASLAVLMGKDMNEAARTLALTMSSGYSEGLQKLGININRVMIEEEAHRMGIEKNYQAMTQNERAIATLNIVQKQMVNVMEDIDAYYDTAPGKIDKTKAAWTDLTQFYGSVLLPVWGEMVGVLGKLIELLLKLEKIQQRSRKEFWGSEGSYKAYYKDVVSKGGTAMSLEDFYAQQDEMNMLGDTYSRGDTVGTDEYEATQMEAIEDVYKDIYKKIRDAQKREQKDLIKAEKDYYKNIAEINKDYFKDLEDLNIDHQRKLADIDEDYSRKREEIARDYFNSLADLERNYAQDRAKAERDYANDVAKINAKYQQDQLDAEEKFQRDLAKLRLEFLYDLEDAVRERDARQALQLIKKYARDREALNLERQQQAQDRTQAYQAELEEARIRRDERLNELRLETEYRRQELAIRHQQELADAQLAWQRQKQDEARRYAEEQKELQERHKQQLDDAKKTYDELKEEIKQRTIETIKDLIDNLVLEDKLTKDAIDSVVARLRAAFGSGGYVEGIYKYMYEMVAAYATEIARINANMFGSAPSFSYPDVLRNSVDYNQAEGGSFVANSPTVAQFGERGAELVTAVPLTRPGMNVGSLVGGSFPAGLGKSSSGKIGIEVLLSPDLEARVIENSLGELSNVLVKYERSR